MIATLILTPDIDEARVLDWAAKQGLDVTSRAPATGSRRIITFSGSLGMASWLIRAGATHPLLVIEGEASGVEALARAGRDALGVLGLDDFLGKLSGATSAIDRVRAMHDVAILAELAPCDERTRMLDLVAAHLVSDDRALRYLAAEVVSLAIDRHGAELLARASESFPDLAPARDLVLRMCEAEADGTLGDAPTDDWWELEQRARAGAAAGQWKRVVAASEALLASSADHVQGLYYRGLAHEAFGEPVLALAYFGACAAELELEISVNADDDDDGFDDGGGDDDDDDEQRENRALLSDARSKIASLRERVLSTSEAERAAEEDALVARLLAWQDGEAGLAAGAADALAGVYPTLDPLFLFLRGSYHSNLELVDRAYQTAKDSLAVELRRAELLRKSDRPSAKLAFEALLTKLRRNGVHEPSSLARLIARFAGTPALADVLEQLARVSLEEEDRVRALELAEELLKLNPDSASGWQVRAHALLFEHRYAEAAEAYADAIAELGRIREEGESSGSLFFGQDPRAMLHMNRACAFGRMGQKAETLDCLRRAVRLDVQYAESAKTEDWIECVWGTPEFEAITRQESRALVTSEELEPAHVANLISQCKGRFYRREVAAALEAGERAAELAGYRGDRAQRIEAMSALAFALAFSGQAGRAVELMAEVVALAQGGTPEERADARAHQALALQAHGDLTGAERAYLDGIELRRQVYGDDAPILAKSYGDLARLYLDQERPGREVRETTEKGIAILARYLENHTHEHDAWAEAITDRATLEGNLAHMFAREELWSEALDTLDAASTTFTRASEHALVQAGVLESAEELARRIASRGGTGAARARAIAERIGLVRFPGSAAVRRERAFFAGLERLVARMRAQGVADAAIAHAFREAAKGPDRLDEDLRQVPELATLAAELASRAARWPTFLVTSAMSMELLASDLDSGLAGLRELAVSHAEEADAANET